MSKKMSQTPKAVKLLEDKLQMIADFMELLLNYFVLLCPLNCVGAVLDMLQPPLWYWFLPLVYPVSYWLLREKVKRLSLFLVLHLPVAICMPMIAFQLNTYRAFWVAVALYCSVVYTFHSIYARIREKKSDTIPFGMAVGVAVPMFLVSAYVESDLACTRILVLSILYVFIWLLRSYLEYFANYLAVNRSAAGAMPERSILQVSVRNVLISTSAITAFLIAFVWSPLASGMTAFAKEFGFLLLKGVAFLISLVAKTPEDGEEILNSDMMNMGQTELGPMDSGEPSLFARILEMLLFVVAIVVAVLLVYVAIRALARFLMENFYEDRGMKKEVDREGFLEEEERLSMKDSVKQFRLPILGGTPEQKVRRIFWKAVTTEYEKAGADRPEAFKTARQLAKKFGEEKPEEWNGLADLYEKARYSQDSVTKEDLRQANALARRIKR